MSHTDRIFCKLTPRPGIVKLYRVEFNFDAALSVFHRHFFFERGTDNHVLAQWRHYECYASFLLSLFELHSALFFCSSRTAPRIPVTGPISTSLADASADTHSQLLAGRGTVTASCRCSVSISSSPWISGCSPRALTLFACKLPFVQCSCRSLDNINVCRERKMK